jgi:hypothetical protein
MLILLCPVLVLITAAVLAFALIRFTGRADDSGTADRSVPPAPGGRR